MLKGLGIGRIVHYVIRDGDLVDNRSTNQHRPAIIVNDWRGLDRDDGYSNLVVFVDGQNDQSLDRGDTMWVTSRVYSNDKEPGTWHWPETV